MDGRMNLSFERGYVESTRCHVASLRLAYGEREWRVDILVNDADADPEREQVAIALGVLARKVREQ